MEKRQQISDAFVLIYFLHVTPSSSPAHSERISNKQPFPHPVAWKRTLDRLVVILGFLNIIATLPQILEIWVGKNASGVSAISWAYYSFFTAILLLYGLAHHEKPIIITYSASTILYTIVFVGAIIY